MPTDAASPADQLRGRLRQYFLVVFGMIGGAVVLLIALGAVLQNATDPKTAAQVTTLTAGVLMLGVVGGSWVAVSKYWRCPACEKSLYWQVSLNMSVFSSARSECPGCGVELFTTDRKRRVRRLMVLVGIGFAFALGGAMVSGFLVQKNKMKTTQQSPPPPG
jgi:cytochrome c biogenesis factor